MANAADLVAFLREVRLFRDIPTPDLMALAGTLRERDLRRRQILFREGDRGDEMFIVRRGTMLISKAVTGKVEQVLVRVERRRLFRRDEPVRRIAALRHRPGRDGRRAAGPRTRQPARDDRDGAAAAAAFFYAMVQVFMDRLRRSTQQVAEATRWGLEATGLDVEP